AVARFPDRFSGAVFLDAPGDLRSLSEKDLAEWRGSMAPDRFRGSSRAWVGQILPHAEPETRQPRLAPPRVPPRETYVGSMESILQYDPTIVRRFPGPKLLVTVRTFDGPLSMRAAVPELPNVFIEDTSHWLQLDQPAEIAAILRRFLADV